AKRDAAKEKLDKTLGKGAGDKAEQLQNDLKSDDPNKRAEAQKKIDAMQKQADEMAKSGNPKQDTAAAGKKVDPKEVQNALDDLNSDDPNKRAEAKRKLDEALGKGTSEKAEEFTKQTKSDDFRQQADGRKGLDDIVKKAEQLAKQAN